MYHFSNIQILRHHELYPAMLLFDKSSTNLDKYCSILALSGLERPLVAAIFLQSGLFMLALFQSKVELKYNIPDPWYLLYWELYQLLFVF